MQRTAKEWQELLSLEQELDDELLELLEAAKDDVLTSKGKSSGKYFFRIEDNFMQRLPELKTKH
jgi:hypothetical protein